MDWAMQGVGGPPFSTLLLLLASGEETPQVLAAIPSWALTILVLLSMLHSF